MASGVDSVAVHNPGSFAGMEGAMLNCQEMEFLAEWEEVEVIPNFQGDKLHMICGEYGPFYPNRVVKVPLFTAVNLKDSRKCRIEVPMWLRSSTLERVLEAERDASEQATDLTEMGIPFHYTAIAHILLKHAADDVEALRVGEVHDCRRLLRDIEDVRASKIRKGTRMVMDEVKNKDHAHDVSAMINFRNLTFSELNQARPTLTLALDTLADLNPRTVRLCSFVSLSRPVLMRGCGCADECGAGAGWGAERRRRQCGGGAGEGGRRGAAAQAAQIPIALESLTERQVCEKHAERSQTVWLGRARAKLRELSLELLRDGLFDLRRRSNLPHPRPTVNLAPQPERKTTAA